MRSTRFTVLFFAASFVAVFGATACGGSEEQEQRVELLEQQVQEQQEQLEQQQEQLEQQQELLEQQIRETVKEEQQP